MEANDHARYEDDLAAFMLGALEGDEEAEFERHLATCRHCQARERWLRASVDVLPSAVEQLEPPPAMRDRLMETVRREAATAPEAATPRVSARAPARGLRGWLGSLSLRPATALAAVVLLLAAGVVGYAIGDGGGGGSGTSTIAAAGTPQSPETTGSIVRTGDAGVLRVSDLPHREGRIYEVWLVQDDKPVASALFQVRQDGTGSAGIPHGLDDSTQVMVSSEPPGGSEAPTTEPVLSANL